MRWKKPNVGVATVLTENKNLLGVDVLITSFGGLFVGSSDVIVPNVGFELALCDFFDLGYRDWIHD